MNDQQDESLAAATREIISVSEQLTRLRGAVQQHSAAAGGLNELSGTLSELARVLQKLPDPIARVAEKGEQLVGSIEQALGPAGNLLAAVNELSDSIAKLPSEAMLGERFAMLQQNIDDSSRESASALVRMDAKVDGIADSLKKLAGHAGETTRKLDVLDRLARRSLFAILTGRDGEEKRD